MSKGSSDTSQSYNQTQTSTPNNLPYLQQGWGAAENLLNGGSPLVNNGMNLVGTGATAGNAAAVGGLNTATGFANGGTANGANQYLTSFANGSMMGNNPYYQNMVNQLSASLQPQIDGSFGASGRYGSGADANAFGSALTNEAGQLGYQNYTQGLANMLSADQQLSTNNTNSTNQALGALDLIPGLSGASTAAGQSAITAGQSPTTNYAEIMNLLGSGGGTQTGNGTSNSQTNTYSFNPLSLFGLNSGGGGTLGGDLLSFLGLGGG